MFAFITSSQYAIALIVGLPIERVKATFAEGMRF